MSSVPLPENPPQITNTITCFVELITVFMNHLNIFLVKRMNNQPTTDDEKDDRPVSQDTCTGWENNKAKNKSNEISLQKNKKRIM